MEYTDAGIQTREVGGAVDRDCLFKVVIEYQVAFHLIAIFLVQSCPNAIVNFKMPAVVQDIHQNSMLIVHCVQLSFLNKIGILNVVFLKKVV